MTWSDHAVLLNQNIPSLRERKRAFDRVWLLGLAALLLAIVLPWYHRALDFDLGPAAWSVFVYALFYVAMAAVTDRLTDRRTLLVTSQLMQVLGILFLAGLWHLVGGLANPMFLVVFFVPVMASGILIVGWHSGVIAALSVVAAGCVAFAESPQLRWYLDHMGLPIGGLLWAFPDRLPGSGHFNDLAGGPATHFVELEVFAVFQLTCALLSRSMARTLLKVYARFCFSATATGATEGFFQAAWEESPDPTLLLFPETTQIAHVSGSFLRQMLLHNRRITGEDLFELIQFEEPRRVRHLIAVGGGELRDCSYRIGQESRMAYLQVRAVQHDNSTYCSLVIRDLTELLYLQAALDAAGEPLLVVGFDQRLRYANKAAATLLGEAYFGMEVEPCLEVTTGGDEERSIVLKGCLYEASRVSTRLSGGREDLTILRLREKKGGAERSVAGAARRLLAVLPIAFCLSHGSIRADDRIYVGLQADDLSRGESGAGTSVGWLHSLSASSEMETGLFLFSLADSHWSYGRLGASCRPSDRVSLHGEIDLGGGRRQDVSFDYKSERLGFSYGVIPRRLYAELEDGYVDIDSVHGNLLKAGVRVFPGPSLALRMAYDGSTSGNINAQYLSGGIEVKSGSGTTVMSGFATGRSRPQVSTGLASASVLNSRELFAGLKIPFGPSELTVTLDATRTGDVRRNTLLLSWKIPLSAGGSSS